MIGFGELRKRSLAWHMDIAEVERVYATDWLLHGVFEQADLAARLILRGGAALRYAYGPNYHPAEPPEFLLREPQDRETLKEQILNAVHAAGAGPSGVKYLLVALAPGNVKVEYTGPLGRRSAAQLRIVLSLVPGTPRLAPVRVPLVHPFAEPCPSTVVALAREELAAERLAALGAAPRARDVYDLWFLLTHWSNEMDLTTAQALAEQIAREKGLAPRQTEGVFSSAHRPVLERTWDRALRHVLECPPFPQVERDLVRIIPASG